MTGFDPVSVLQHATLLGAKLCAPPLIAALAAGVVVSALQAVTQISDSTLSFLPKLAAACAALWIASSWMQAALGTFGRETFDTLVVIGGR